MSRTAHGGFTLFELMLTLAVAAVLAAVAIPNMRDFIRNNRLTGASNDLLRSIQLARAEAIKQQRVVAVCASANPNADEPSCSGGAFTGWIVFADTDNSWQREAGEPLIAAQTAVESITIVNDEDSIMSYTQMGMTNLTPGQTPVNNIVLCDERGNSAQGNNSTARALFIETTGRSRVSKLQADVSTALDATGDCP